MLRLQTERECQLARLEGLQAHAWINVRFENCVGIFRRDLLDFHAARRRRHEHRPGFYAVNDDSQIKFFLGGQSLFD